MRKKAAFALLTLTCALGCAKRPVKAPAPQVVRADRGSIRTELMVGQAPLRATFTVRNLSDRPRTFHFRSSQTFDLAVLGGSGAELWRWSADRAFAAMLQERELAAEPWVFREEIPLELAPGRYRLKAWLANHPEVGNQLDFEIR